MRRYEERRRQEELRRQEEQRRRMQQTGWQSGSPGAPGATAYGTQVHVQQHDHYQSDAPSGQYAEFRSSNAHSSHSESSASSQYGFQYDSSSGATHQSSGWQRSRSDQRIHGERIYR
ncbi:hypothetical protein GCK32_021991 [Trichostrongylus colubriformis]|uniref:Uncharacterized protein n=1 Tax=Trichostrongylus colubriformis TaxID=6319 RepID=A0AAN8EUM0_TRICO